MKNHGLRIVSAALLLTLVWSAAFAQGSGATSSISGVVVDTNGGVIPGANIEAKNDATGGVFTAITAGNGTFAIPALNIGTYTVTVTLTGFKKAVLKGVTVTAGGPATVQAKLEVGGIEDSIVVQGATEIVQTNSSAASTTLNTKQIMSLPLASRNTLDFVAFLPGIQTASSTRSSTVDGLPQSSINITIDGVSIQDNYLKTTDGFFARMSPRLDAVEEVTVTSAAQGAEANGQGATQIKFTTRSGTSQFNVSGYHYYQSDKLNSNTYANRVRGLPKGPLTLNQPGFRAGGPIYLPGIYDGRSKAFFFMNFEMSRQPSTITTNSTLLTADAQNGVFRYTNGPAGGINLYALAAAAGFASTADPIVAKLLMDIRNSTTNPGTLSDVTGSPNVQRYTFQQSVSNNNNFPTVRFDYNLSLRNKLMLSYNRNKILSVPDTTNTAQRTWPGFPVTAEQASVRYALSSSLRTTLGTSLVNEFHVGASGGPTQFSPSLAASMWSGSVANQGGYALGINAAGITNAGPGAGLSSREPTTRIFDDTVNWLKGSHNLSFGGSYGRYQAWLLTQTRVPSITFGGATDPAASIFSAANFPGSSSADRNSARDLYAVLVGSVTSIGANARLDPNTGKYVYLGDSRAEGRLQEMDLFVQDSWRVRPNLSINMGLRYPVQLAFFALNGSYSTATPADVFGVSGYVPGCDLSNATPSNCNLFKPGTMPGQKPSYQNFTKGVPAYATDWNNLSPSIGFNWTPHAAGGFWRTLFGQQGDTSFSGGWVRSYERHGMSDFTGVFGSNPGIQVSATRAVANGNLIVPLLFRNGYLGAPTLCSVSNTTGCMQDAPAYPLTNTVATGSVNIFDPNLKVPYSDTWTAGIQRAMGRKAAIEVRYIGTRNRDQWINYNFNESDIIENGFLNEFKLAQANLQANIAAGGARAGSFAYFGPGTGTSPLPIYLAYFSGIPAGQATDQTKYNSSNFTNSSFVNPLAKFNPAPFTPAGTNSGSGLAGDPQRQANAILAGLPANFFRVNPDMLGGANVTGNGGFSKYNSMQVQFRRRLSDGLQFDANYVLGGGYDSTRFSFRVPSALTRTTGGGGDVTHAFKATAVYELPFGQGRRLFSGAGSVLDRIVNGWQVSGTMRLQSGRLFDLGNVRVVGMSVADAQSLFKLRKENDTIIYAWPQDIVDQTILAYNTSATSATGYGAGGPPSGRYFAPANGPDCIETIANGYGDCAVRSLVLTGPIVKNVDLSLRKMTKLAGRATFEFSIDALNVFNIVTFTPATGVSGTTLASYQAGLPGSSRTVQLGSRFTW